MTDSNRSRELAFHGPSVEATLVENVRDYMANGVVTNLSEKPMLVGGDVPGVIPRWKSTTLRGGTIVEAERVSVVNIPDPTNLGGVCLGEWEWLGKRMAEFPRTTPLFISPYDIVGQVTVNPWKFSNHPDPRDDMIDYDIRLNLWWAPQKTDCGVHNTHSFLELHTQIHGNGKIQVFRDSAGEEMYRELSAAPGDTHEPLVRVTGPTTYTYPWHRGWTEDDCVWMAIELHPRA